MVRIFFLIISLFFISKSFCLTQKEKNQAKIKLNHIELLQKELNACDQLKGPKKIKKCKNKALLKFIKQNISKPNSVKPKPNLNDLSFDDKIVDDKEILTNIANMISSFGHLIIN